MSEVKSKDPEIIGEVPIRVEIEYKNRTHKITDPTECRKWIGMVNSQATLAFTHGFNYEEIDWEVTEKEDNE